MVIRPGNLCITAMYRLVGFEELGNSDGFEPAALELRLQMSGKRGRLIAFYLRSNRRNTRRP